MGLSISFACTRTGGSLCFYSSGSPRDSSTSTRRQPCFWRFRLGFGRCVQVKVRQIHTRTSGMQPECVGGKNDAPASPLRARPPPPPPLIMSRGDEWPRASPDIHRTHAEAAGHQTSREGCRMRTSVQPALFRFYLFRPHLARLFAERQNYHQRGRRTTKPPPRFFRPFPFPPPMLSFSLHPLLSPPPLQM